MCDEILLRLALVTAEELDAARRLRARQGGALTEHLVRGGAVSEAALVEALSAALFVPTATADELATIDLALMKLLPAELMVEMRAVPIAVDREMLTVAFADVSDAQAVSEIAFFAGRDIARVAAPPTAICALLEYAFGIRVLSEMRTLASRSDRSASAR